MSEIKRNVLAPKRVVLHGLGPFDHFELSFEQGTDPKRADTHLLVGVNGTGKTTLLHALAVGLGVEQSAVLSRWAHGPGSYALVETTEAAVLCDPYGNGRAASDALVRLMTDRNSVIAVIGDSDGRAIARFHSDLPRSDVTLLESFGSEVRRSNSQLSALEAAAFFYPTTRTLAAAAGRGGSDTNPVVAQTPLLYWLFNEHVRANLAHADGAPEEAARSQEAIDLLFGAFDKLFEQQVGYAIDRQRLEAHLTVSGTRLPASTLAQGVQSLIAWLGDVVSRLDLIKWTSPGPVTERPFVLLLDEIELHLHPKLQRKVLDVFQSLFPNAMLIGSTHSPHVVTSASDGWIYPLSLAGGRVVCGDPLPSRPGISASAALRDVLDVPDFSPEAERLLTRFQGLRNEVLRGNNAAEIELQEVSKLLSAMGTETHDIVELERRQLDRRLGR